MRDVRLPLRRPSQDAIENLLHLFFSHMKIVVRLAKRSIETGLVPLAGLEPARCCHHLILSQM
jgi:hypothetical protein